MPKVTGKVSFKPGTTINKVPPSTDGEWVEGTIRAGVDSGGEVPKFRDIDASILDGLVAVHESVRVESDSGKYSVGHVPTGLEMCAVRSEANAKMIARVVVKHWRNVLSLLTTKEMQPLGETKRLMEYCHKCRDMNGYVDPTPYLGEK